MKNMKRGFKLTSPLKATTGGGGDKNTSASSSTTTTSNPAQSGGYKVTSTKTTVKKSDTGAEVKIAPKAERYKKPRPKGWSDAKLAAHNKKKRAEWDAQDKKAEESKASSKSGSEETTTKNTPELTEEKAGTTSDTFTSEERRVQNRGEKVVNRQERQLGKQGLRRDKRAMKSSADWDKMTSAEKKAAKYELKKGQTAEDKASGKKGILETKFGKEFKENVEQERKMAKGQGEQNKSLTRQEIERPGEATTTRKAQYDQGANPLDRSNTKNYAEVTKAVEGNKKVKVEPGSKLPESVEGTTKTSNSETKSTTSAPKEEPKKYDATKNAPFLEAGNQGPENAPSKMKASALKFVMKGFGSKAGFNFNKKK
jgi:hypothetical protein